MSAKQNRVWCLWSSAQGVSVLRRFCAALLSGPIHLWICDRSLPRPAAYLRNRRIDTQSPGLLKCWRDLGGNDWQIHCSLSPPSPDNSPSTLHNTQLCIRQCSITNAYGLEAGKRSMEDSTAQIYGTTYFSSLYMIWREVAWDFIRIDDTRDIQPTQPLWFSGECKETELDKGFRSVELLY